MSAAHDVVSRNVAYTLDQLTALDHGARLGDFVGRLSTPEMLDVARAVRLVLGMR